MDLQYEEPDISHGEMEAYETLMDFMNEMTFDINEDTDMLWNIREGFLLGTYYVDGEKHMVEFYPEFNIYRDKDGDTYYSEEIAEAVDKMIDSVIRLMTKELVKNTCIQICDEPSTVRDD